MKLIDISNNKYGNLIVIKRDLNKGHETCWLCKCNCGKEKIIRKSALINGSVIDCGCGSRKRRSEQNSIDLVGQKFGILTVINRSSKFSEYGMALWDCKCECGNIIEYNGKQLRYNIKTDCGCKTVKRKLSNLQLDVLLGTMLGDGCLVCRNNRTTCLRVNHSSKQLDFVKWKYEIFKNISSEVKIIKNLGYGKESAIFSTNSLFQLTDIYKILYKKGIKKVSQEYLDLIKNPISLAVWYMDDGSLSQKNGLCSIHTEGFKKNQVQLICKWLKEKWNIDCSVFAYKSYYRISLTANGRREFHKLIKPYIIPSMLYKINHRFDINYDRNNQRESQNKPIEKINKDGEISTYKSIKEAIQNGFGRWGIWNALKNNKKYKGCDWKYLKNKSQRT